MLVNVSARSPSIVLLLVVSALLLVVTPSQGEEIYVNDDSTTADSWGITAAGDNSNDGLDRSSPVRTIDRALQIAEDDYDTASNQIRIGAGNFDGGHTIDGGEYEESAGATLRILGSDSTAIDTNPTGRQGLDVAGNNVSIRHLSIDGFDSGGIRTNGAENFTLENVSVRNTGDTGVSLVDSQGSEMLDVDLRNNVVGFFGANSDNLRLEADTAVNNDSAGFLLQELEADTVINLRVRDNGDIGIRFAGVENSPLVGSVIEGNAAAGVMLSNSNNISLQKNIVRNNDDGFFVSNSNTGLYLQNLVSKNNQGMIFDESSDLDFRRNEVKESDFEEVELHNATSFDTFQHNNFLNLSEDDEIVNNTAGNQVMRFNYWAGSSGSWVNGVTSGNITHIPYRLTKIDTGAEGTDLVAPGPPQDVTADTSAANRVELTWDHLDEGQDGSDDIARDEYRVYRSTSDTITDWKDEADDTFIVSNSNDTTFTDHDVDVGTTYYYRVTAYHSHGDFENESYFSPIGGPVGASPEDYGPEIYVNDSENDTDVFTEAAGDDSKNGTRHNPLRTLQRASEVSQDNDTIYVDAGTYTDTATVDTGDVAVVGAGVDTTVFDVDGSGTAIRVTQNNGPNEDNVLENFTVRDAVTGVVLEGEQSRLTNVEVRGSTTGISISGQGNGVTNVEVRGGTTAGVHSAGDDNKISNNLLTENEVGVRLTGMNNLVVQNQIDGNDSYQVSVSDDSNEVRRNNIIPSSTQPDSGVNTEGNTPDLTYNWWNATDSTVIRARQSSPGEYIPHRLGGIDTGVGADSVAPAAPSGVDVDTSVAREISLRWDEPTTEEDGSPLTDIEGYRIYRLENEGDTDDWTLHHRATIDDPSDTDFTDAVPDIEKDQGYFYRITSFDTNDNGVFNESYFTDVHAGTWVNRVPRAGTATVETQVDSSVSFALTGSDSDADTLAYSIVSGPDSGTLDTAPRNGGSGIDTAVTYDPDTPYVGADSFRFTVSDGDGGVDTGTITIETLVETSIRVEQFRVDGQDTPLVAGRGDTFEARIRFNNIKSGPGEVSLDTSALEIRDGLGNVVNDSFNVTRAGTDVRVNGNDTAVGRWVVDYPESNESQLHGNFRVVLDFNDMTARNVFQGNVKDVGDSLASNSRTLNVLPEPIEADQTPDDFGLDTGGVNVQSVELDLGIVNDDAVLDTDAAGITDGDSIFRMVQRGDTASIDTPIANPNYGFASSDGFDTDLAEAYGDLRELTETEAGFSTRNLRILSNNLLSITLWKNEVFSDSNFISPSAYLGDSDVLREESEVTVRNVAFNGKPERLRVIKLLPRDGSGDWRWTLVDNLDGEVGGTPKVTGEEGNYTVRFEVSEDTGFSVFQVIASGVVRDAPADEAVVYPNPFVPHDNNDRTGCYSGCGRSGIFFGAGPDRGFPAGSRIKIYNVKGEMIDEFTLFNGGIFQWDAETRNGEKVASGVYIYRIETPEGTDRNGKFAIVR